MADYPERRASETTRAYEAAQAYFAMGADRSIDAVSQRLAKSVPLMKRWSAQHDWVERAKAYDLALSREAARAAGKRYLRDLEMHRQKAIDASRGLYAVAGVLLQRLSEQANRVPQVIRGEDGHDYEILPTDVPASMLGTIRDAFCCALDLEAHVLGIDKLMRDLSQIEPARGDG